MVRITFLGTGGGRFATVYQVRNTGGIYIEAEANIHLDPGPGAVINLNRLGVDPADTDGVLVSHCHPDHYADAEVLIEGMTRCNFSQRGLVAGSRSVIDGAKDFAVNTLLPAALEYDEKQAVNLAAITAATASHFIVTIPTRSVGFSSGRIWRSSRS